MTGEDYPKNFQEFIARFKTDEDCRQYLFKIRWPNGFSCPKCEGGKYWMNNRGLAHCTECDHQTSIISSTIFQGTRKPLLLWFHVIWWVSAQKTVASANNHRDFMGFGSYETAWAWLPKLRRAMVRPGIDRLKGEVVVDETYIGGEEKGENNRGRGAKTKILVIVATEYRGKQIGRVRFRRIDTASSGNLMSFIFDNVEEGSRVITDGWEGYTPLSKSEKYRHVKNVISQEAGKKRMSFYRTCTWSIL